MYYFLKVKLGGDSDLYQVQHSAPAKWKRYESNRADATKYLYAKHANHEMNNKISTLNLKRMIKNFIISSAKAHNGIFCIPQKYKWPPQIISPCNCCCNFLIVPRELKSCNNNYLFQLCPLIHRLTISHASNAFGIYNNCYLLKFQMSPLVNKSIDNFINLLQDHCDGNPFNIHA